MSWQDEHIAVEKAFLEFLGEDAPFILKGGTALMFYYGLPRFSEDLDFDVARAGTSILRIVDRFAQKHDYGYRVRKDKPLGQRVMLDYGGTQALKIETSARRKNISTHEFVLFDGVKVYTIDRLAQFKTNAYLARDRLRDLFDVSYIINSYWNQLSDTVRTNIADALSVKGIEQFDALIAENSDPLIDAELLAEQFLNAYDIAGIARDGEYVLPDATRLSHSDPPPASAEPSYDDFTWDFIEQSDTDEEYTL